MSADDLRARAAQAVRRARTAQAILLALVVVACSAIAPPTSESVVATPPGTAPSASGGAGSTSGRSPGASAGPSSDELIADAFQKGEIDEERALLYSVFAAFGDPRLPSQYVGARKVEFEPPIDLTRIEAGLGTLSPEVRDQIAPFLIPPIHAGSWWDLRHNGTASVVQPARAQVRTAQSLLPILDDQWSSVATSNGRVRIWYPAGNLELGRLAVSTKDEIDAVIWPRLVSLMGFEALPDQGGTNPAHGPDDALDLIIQTDTGWATTAGRAPNLCERTAAWILLDPRVTTELEIPWNSAVAHELMHAFQFALDLQTLSGGPDGCSDGEYVWWAEATATWIEDFMYPAANSEWSGERGTNAVTDFMTTLGYLPTVSTYWTNRGVGGRNYGAYLFPFYLADRFGDSVVADSWRLMSGARSEAAIDSAIRNAAGQAGGLERVWADFAVALINEPPFDDFMRQDGITHRFLEIGRENTAFNSTIRQIDQRIWLSPTDDYEAIGVRDGSIRVDWERAIGDGRSGLAAPALAYAHYVFDDPTVRSVGWYNGMTHTRETETGEIGSFWSGKPRPSSDIEGLRVQALIKFGGDDWQLEDWTDYPWRTFCRDVAAERLTELVIVVSNGRADERFLESPPYVEPDLGSRIWISDMGCYQWRGSVRLQHDNGNFHLTIDAENVLLERVIENQPPYGPNPAVNYRAVEGQMRWNLSNSDEVCTEEGNGTSAFDDSLAITTMNFLVEGPWYRSGGGMLTGAEGKNIPITCGGEVIEPYFFTPLIPLPADGSPASFEDGGHWTGTSTHSDSNVVVTWDLTAVSE